MKETTLNNEWQVVESTPSESEKWYRVMANVLFALLVISCLWCVALHDENKNLKSKSVRAMNSAYSNSHL